MFRVMVMVRIMDRVMVMVMGLWLAMQTMLYIICRDQTSEEENREGDLYSGQFSESLPH
jgi:hypothetical protein